MTITRTRTSTAPGSLGLTCSALALVSMVVLVAAGWAAVHAAGSRPDDPGGSGKLALATFAVLLVLFLVTTFSVFQDARHEVTRGAMTTAVALFSAVTIASGFMSYGAVVGNGNMAGLALGYMLYLSIGAGVALLVGSRRALFDR
jgi:cytochrome bd-type quinol oxidase subunit 2